MSKIVDFDSLIEAAKKEPQPQEFLFVFLRSVLPENATPSQIQKFHKNEGGMLLPIMQVHKSVDELSSFKDLVDESLTYSEEWQIVLTGCLSGLNGQRPEGEIINEHLNTMIDSVKKGLSLSKYLAFNRDGVPLFF
ncbi:MAG: ribonucleotide reductase subunit alpha [Deltaproteobacteria bacterium]|nr:ribonucleotide reductase subunit alpha [Deltaproteobacteria bacterium]